MSAHFFNLSSAMIVEIDPEQGTTGSEAPQFRLPRLEPPAPEPRARLRSWAAEHGGEAALRERVGTLDEGQRQVLRAALDCQRS